MLSAISATLFAMRVAMIAYADETPVAGASPATEYAFWATGVAFCCTGFAAFLTGCLAGPPLGFLACIRGAEGFLGKVPFVDGRCACVAAMSVIRNADSQTRR